MQGDCPMLKGKVIEVKDLTVLQTKQMYSIMTKYYDNISEGVFCTDLLKKRDVVLLCNEDDDIYGFTTLAIFPHDEQTQLIFSGDTIIEKEYWGKNDLSHAWIINALSHAEKFNGKTYWLLLAKGYKIYKFLHTFFNKFYPRVDTETPQEIQKIIDKFSTEQFGKKYHNGIYTAGKDYLKEEFAQIDETKLKDKNTAFFLEKNPNYAKGDELICITELCEKNINRIGKRVLGR